MADAIGVKELSKEELADALLLAERPIIAMHSRPDGDTVGAGIALCEIFRMLGKEPSYVCDDKIPVRLSFLTEGYETWDGNEGEVIAVDVASPSQLGALFERLSVKLMIDHHERGVRFADGYVPTSASSAAEAIYNVAEVLIARGLIKMTRALAYPLYAAMSSDTGCFCYSNASEECYRKAAALISTGIDFSDINHRLFNSKLPEQVRAEGFVASKIKTACDGKIAYATVSLSERRSLGLEYEHLDTAIDVVRGIFGVRLAFIIKETDKGDLRASLRSTGADVAKIAESFGGGGHHRAAGCSVSASNIDEAARAVLALAEKEIQ